MTEPVEGTGVAAAATRALLTPRRRASGASVLVRAMPLPASRGWALLGVCVAGALTSGLLR